MRKILFFFLILLLLLTGCSYPENHINAISREDGSGTRDAFTSLFKLTQEDADGTTLDLTNPKSEITNSTAVVLQTVRDDPNAIGYMSMGSLNDKVKAVSINNIQASTQNVKEGTYPIFRPFVLILNDQSGELEEDFISFIQSKTGSEIIESNGYIAQSDTTKDYQKSSLKGKLVINGSSSVTPVMESLAEKYHELNPQIEVEVQQTDSTTGISSITEGISDIGMSSRELKDEEIDQGLKPITFAYDGLAIIVNNSNPINNLSIDDVHDIYTGEISLWTDLEEN